MTLDPVLAAMLSKMAEADSPDPDKVTLADRRAGYRALQSIVPKPDISEVLDSMAGDIPIRIYRNVSSRVPCVIYFHGGGWVIGDLETHDGICRQLAIESGYTVIAVDYRLAPENPFPAPLNDCYQAVSWITRHADELNIDGNSIAVAGDSAGGNLSAAICLKARDENGPRISMQLMICPVTDSSFDTPSYAENGEGYLLTTEGMASFWDSYSTGDSSVMSNPLAAPMKAESLSDLPPACIITAEYDPLRDEGAAYGDRLREAGAAVSYRCFDGMIHTFFGMTDMLAGARDAMQMATDALKTTLGPR